MSHQRPLARLTRLLGLGPPDRRDSRRSRARTRAQMQARIVVLALTWLRLALAPMVVVLGLLAAPGPLIAATLVIALLSDVLDGAIARRYHIATAGLRRLDSAVDSAFYLAAAWCAWRLHAGALAAHLLGIELIVGTLLLNHLVETIKFGREGSYHARSAKIWGLLLFSALLLLFVTGSAALVPVAIVAGLVSHLENLAITLVLPEWRYDVRSVENAWRIRESMRRPAPLTGR